MSDDLADVFSYDPAAGLRLPTSSEQPPQPQQPQQQQQLPAADTQATPAEGGPAASLLQHHQHHQHQRRATGNPAPPPPLPPRPPPRLVRVSAGNAPIPPASPPWPLLTPALFTANAPSATAADATATTVVDLLSSWNPPARSSPQATGAATPSIEDVAGATSAEERLSAVSPPPRDEAPVPLTADFAATEATAGAPGAYVPPQSPPPPPYPAASAAAPHARRPPPPYPAAALQTVEAAAAAAGFAGVTSDGGESAPGRSHGRLDDAPAALAALRSPTEGRGPPVEDSLTAEEAQAILDAADMAAAEAVVAAAEAAAAEAAEAGAVAVAALADLQSPTGAARSPVTDAAVAASPQSPPTLSRHDSVVRAALRQIAAAEVAAAAGSESTPPPSSGAGGATTAAGLSDANGSATEAAGAWAAPAASLTEDQEIAAAVAAVAELEARDRLQSSAAGAGGEGGGAVVRGTPGEEDSVAVIGVSRCALCRSSVERVAPLAGAPQNKNSSNCRNCWRAVCDNCVGTYWARTMVPPRYTVDSNDYRMRVCKTCDAAMEAFRKALLLGQAEEAMSAYSTGCVNLDRPYTIYHGELPVHCAAAGGNLDLLVWLVDELGCRLYVNFHKKEPVRDLRRLTVLGAAAVNGQVQVMRYLVNQKGCCVSEIAHIPTLKSALDACLHGSAKTRDGERSRYKMEDTAPGSPADTAGVSISSGAAASMAASAAAADEDDDCCIVCFDSAVDCTLVPCGHHCCCLTCAAKFSLCPVCRTPVTQKIKAISV